MKGLKHNPFGGSEIIDVVPTTEAEREVWNACQLGEGASLAYNEGLVFEFQGLAQAQEQSEELNHINAEILQEALWEVCERHDSLRSTFSADGLTRVVNKWSSLPFEEHYPASNLPPDPKALERFMISTPFDLINGPLVKFCLVNLGPNQQRFIFTAHHLVCDGWSAAVFAKDLMRIYLAKEQRTSLRLPAVAPVVDRSDPEDLAYWTSVFEKSIPEWDIPTDGTRPKLMTYASERIDIELDAELRTRLKDFALKNEVGLFHCLFAAYQIWIHRLSGLSEFVVGVPTAGQPALGSLERMGHFVHLLPFSCSLTPAEATGDFLKKVRSQVLDGLDHQLFTYGTLLKQIKVKREAARPTLVPVMFNFDQGLEMGQFWTSRRSVSLRSIPRVAENFEIFLNITDTAHSLMLEFQYKTDLFSSENMKVWIQSFKNLLEGMVTHGNLSLNSIPWLDKEQEREVLERAAGPSLSFPPGKKIHDLLADNAASFPHLCAYRCAGASISYGELNERANRVALELRSVGMGPGDFIGLCLKRGIDMMVAMFGILKSGAAYVPLDPKFPALRLQEMVASANIEWVLADREEHRSHPIFSSEVKIMDVGALSGGLIDPSLSIGLMETSSSASSAYVIFTSGSTGKPKGVHIGHESVMNFLYGVRQLVPMSSGDLSAAVVSISFDIAVLDLFLPLLTQTPVEIVEQEIIQDGPSLRKLLERENINIMQATPPLWRVLISAGWEGRRDFLAITGGEALPKELAQDLLARVGQLWNMYGPTEITVYGTVTRIENLDITIGKSLANYNSLILDANMNLLPFGVSGELWVGGKGLAIEYLNRPELTQERFVGSPWGRLYRTGDRCRMRRDGNIEYLGRWDAQVKVRGYRIELGEIEFNLAMLEGVKTCVVVAREDRPGDVRLVAYVVGEAKNAKEFLAKRLPEYMVPQLFVTIDKFPLTGSGKIDRRALPAPTAMAKEKVSLPEGELEESLLELWQNLFGACDVEDNFFDLGGHSLLATQVITTLRKKHKILIGLKEIFLFPTIRSLATHLQTKAKSVVKEPIRMANLNVFPATLMQDSIALFTELHEKTFVFNMPSTFILRGDLNIGALEKALNAFVERHDVLHSQFRRQDGNLQQEIVPAKELSLVPLDLSHQENPLGAAHDWMREKINTERDIFAGPHFDYGLVKLKTDEHLLFWLPHILVWDGWCYDLFISEVSKLYGSFLSNTDPSLALPANPLRYGDYCIWHKEFLRSEHVVGQWSHWEKKLSGDIEPCRLSGPRLGKKEFASALESRLLDEEDVTKLTKLAAAHGASLYQFLMGIFGLTVATLEERSELWMSTPVRNRTHDEFINMVGSFVNTIPVKFELKETALASMLRSKELCLESLTHGDIPFANLVEKFTAGNVFKQRALTQFLFSFQDVRERPVMFGPLSLEQPEALFLNPLTTTEFRMWFKHKRAGLLAGADFMSSVHESSRVARFLEIFKANLAQIVRDPLIAIDLLPSISCRGEFRFACPTVAGRSLAEIEEVVSKIAGVTSVQAGWIEGSPALCYTTDGQANNAQLRRALRENMGDQNFKIHVVPELCPRDESGTIELLLQAPRAPQTAHEIWLAELWKEFLGLDKITVNQRFFDLGGRSLQVLQIIKKIAERTEVKLRPLVFVQLDLAQIALLMERSP